MWGSKCTKGNGRAVVDVIDKHDFVVINTTTPTHFSLTGQNMWSLLDLVLVSNSCAFICACAVANGFLGSDHSIVLTTVKATTTSPENAIPKWNFSKDDWLKFSSYCDKTLSSVSISLEYSYCLSETTVREAAQEAIPQSKGSDKISVPWWNKQCDIAVKNKKHSYNRMKRTRLQCDIIIFKRCRAKARRVILEAKTSSWQQYCTSLTSNSNISHDWKVIKSFSGNRSHHILTLVANGISGKNNQHKANILANQFALSSISNYAALFFNSTLPAKKRNLQHTLSHTLSKDTRLFI